MTISFEVEYLTFTFGDGWRASKYDDWTYYRRQLVTMDAKGVDIVAIRDEELFLVEVKDYTNPETNHVPLAELPQVFAAKCLDSMGGLLAASRSAVGDEQDLAQLAVAAKRVRLVLHAQLAPGKGGRLANTSKVIADLQTKLRTRVKGIDAHALVESQTNKFGFWDFKRTVGKASST